MQEIGNLLNNPGFEKGTPDSWQTYVTGEAHRCIYPEMGRTDSSVSVAIEYISMEINKTASWIQNVQIDPKKKYKLSGYMKTENIMGEGASMRIDWKDKDGKYLGTSKIMERQKGTISWAHFDGTVIPSQNAVGATIILDLYDSSGKVWFDDVSFLSLDGSDHPNIFLNQNEINDINTKTGQDPWKTAYAQLMNGPVNSDKSVAWALQLPIQSVIGGPIPPSGDKHDYYSYIGGDLKYTRYDYFTAIDAGKATRALGLAYAFTKESRYADKAIQLIKGWCVDPATKLNPKFPLWSNGNNRQSRIELGITMPGLFYGASLIWDYSGWVQKNEFISWIRELLTNAKKENWCFGAACQNHENWRLVLIASGAVLLGDSSSLTYAFNRWKELIPQQMDAQGKMVHELIRVTSLDYSMYAVNAMIQVAEIARHHPELGYDLYDYKLSDGRGLEKALDFHVPYVSDPNAPQKWISLGYKQQGGYDGATKGNAQVYELAYAWKQKSSYMGCINRWKRPMYEIRNMGPITLTHAYRG